MTSATSRPLPARSRRSDARGTCWSASAPAERRPAPPARPPRGGAGPPRPAPSHPPLGSPRGRGPVRRMNVLQVQETRPTTQHAPTSESVLAGQIVVVTGGGGGLGSAICHVLARCGATVVPADVRVEPVEALVGQIVGA